MNLLLRTLGAVLLLAFGNVSADDFATVNPPSLNLTLAADESVNVQISITVHPFCIRPYEVDIEATSASALVENLSGVQPNQCGGDTSSFNVEITGTGASQRYLLQFVDAEFGGVLASLPVTINIASAAPEPLLGLLVVPRSLLFQVASNGCTTKDDFRLEVLESNPLQLRLIRETPDPCDAVRPFGTLIRYSYRELGIPLGAGLRVVNPLATIRAR